MFDEAMSMAAREHQIGGGGRKPVMDLCGLLVVVSLR